MPDAEAVLQALGAPPAGVHFIGLVLNRRGYERSVASGCNYRIPGRLFDPFRLEMRLGRLGTTSFTMMWWYIGGIHCNGIIVKVNTVN